MPGILGRIQPRPFCQFFNHACDINTGEFSVLYVPVPIERPEQRPTRYARLFDPCLNGSNRAGLGIRDIRNTDLTARSVLISFRSAQGDCQAIFAKTAVFNVKFSEFGTSESSGESEQDQRSSRKPIIPSSVASTIVRISSLNSGAFCF
jgi:hypothetical protein